MKKIEMGTISLIRTVITEQEILLGYEIVIEIENMPNLKLGKCRIIQE